MAIALASTRTRTAYRCSAVRWSNRDLATAYRNRSVSCWPGACSAVWSIALSQLGGRSRSTAAGRKFHCDFKRAKSSWSWCGQTLLPIGRPLASPSGALFIRQVVGYRMSIIILIITAIVHSWSSPEMAICGPAKRCWQNSCEKTIDCALWRGNGEKVRWSRTSTAATQKRSRSFILKLSKKLNSSRVCFGEGERAASKRSVLREGFAVQGWLFGVFGRSFGYFYRLVLPNVADFKLFAKICLSA